VWEALERYWRPKRRTRPDANAVSGTLHLAQAQSNRGTGGRKRDFPDAERLVKRLVAQELTLSFVPDAEQRLWRTVMRRKYQITRSRVQLHNRLEALLEEAHIKISSVVSDLLGTSARRMLQAVGDGETDPAALAALADQRLRATPEQLRDAFGVCAALHPVYRRLVKLTLDELPTIEDHLTQLDQQMAQLLAHHHAAVKAKGTIFAIVYRRLVPRLGHAQAIGAIAHRLCRLIWKMLHEAIRYEERGPAVSVEAKKVRTRKMIRELRTLGDRVELLTAPSSSPA
jgi:hypothetical protein